MGGMIGSVRRILGALLKEQLVGDETLSTLLCEAERILNEQTPASEIQFLLSAGCLQRSRQV